jgi:CRISPR type I-A-associated protein Csa5
MVTLYTPATGFPDLEIKIAYGLARVAIEAGYEPVIVPNGGFYGINIEGEIVKLNNTFNILAKRILCSDYIPLNTPGITGGSASTIQVKDSEYFDIGIFTNIVEIAEHKKSEPFCRHNVKNRVSNVLGFTASATTGVLCKRDGIDITFYQRQPRRPTEPRDICKTCALLALLGMWYASFIFSVADKEVIVIPIPNQELTGYKLQEIFALQHRVRKQSFKNIPQILIPLVFLSKIPSSADILKEFDLFIAVLSRQQGYHVDGIFLIEIEHYLDYIRQTSFNIATIDRLLMNEAYKALNELNNSIYYRRADSLLKFARLYVQETSTNNWTNLLYLETTNYLLKEVGMIPPNIIENKALQSLARTLRYFIRERKYGYADDIRNARKESRDFEETITKMLREGELRRVQQEQDRQVGKEVKNWIYLPKEDEIKEVFRLANEDFESTKLALVMLAFSLPSKREEEI